MNDLIPVSSRQIGDKTVLSADARDLHQSLKVGTDFNVWILRRIDEYAFEEGRDFQSFLGESSGGRPPKEYFVSLDMAKELSMVERTPEGKEARQYFIECERLALAGARATGLAGRPSVPYREAAAITRDHLRVCKLLGVDEGMARAVTAKQVRLATGLDFTPLLAGNVTLDVPMTPTQLAERVGGGAVAAHINAALRDTGLQEQHTSSGRGGKTKKKWVLTAAGEQYGAMQPYQGDGSEHSGYRPMWFARVIEVIRPALELQDGCRPTAKEADAATS